MRLLNFKCVFDVNDAVTLICFNNVTINQSINHHFQRVNQKLTGRQFSLPYVLKKDNGNETKIERPFSSPESVKAVRWVRQGSMVGRIYGKCGF